MRNENSYKGFFWIVSVLLIIALVGYNLYSGLTVKKIGIPGIFELEFDRMDSHGSKSSAPPNVPRGEIARRIEEFQRELEINEKDQMRARQEIERLRPMLGTDRDAPAAIENQERWIEDLTMARKDLEQELDRLREQR